MLEGRRAGIATVVLSIIEFKLIDRLANLVLIVWRNLTFWIGKRGAGYGN